MENPHKWRYNYWKMWKGNYSFFHNVFKICLLQMHQNASTSGKGLILSNIQQICSDNVENSDVVHRRIIFTVTLDLGQWNANTSKLFWCWTYEWSMKEFRPQIKEIYSYCDLDLLPRSVKVCSETQTLTKSNAFELIC